MDAAFVCISFHSSRKTRSNSDVKGRNLNQNLRTSDQRTQPNQHQEQRKRNCAAMTTAAGFYRRVCRYSAAINALLRLSSKSIHFGLKSASFIRSGIADYLFYIEYIQHFEYYRILIETLLKSWELFGENKWPLRGGLHVAAMSRDVKRLENDRKCANARGGPSAVNNTESVEITHLPTYAVFLSTLSAKGLLRHGLALSDHRKKCWSQRN